MAMRGKVANNFASPSIITAKGIRLLRKAAKMLPPPTLQMTPLLVLLILAASIPISDAGIPSDQDSGVALARTKRNPERLTAYACESSRLNISCSAGQYLDIIRANYGRFSITICNDHGNTDWKVDCQAGRTLRAMQARCGNKNVCDVPVDSSIFGDPCPGTFKYIEVHYACRRDPIQMTTTTARPVPHWGFPGAAGGSGGQTPSWSTDGQVSFSQNNATSSNLTSVDGSGLNGIEAPVGVDPAATPKTIVVKVPKVPHNFGAIQSNKAHLPINIPPKVQAQQPQQPEIISQPRAPAVITSSLEVMDNFTQYCPPVRARGLYWNWTLAGDTAVMQCPSGSTGFAKWSCVHGRPQAAWAVGSPSLQECVSIWLSDLDSKLRSGSLSVINASKTLAENSASQVLYGGDVVLAARMLKHMSERMRYDIQRTVDVSSREAMVTALVKYVVRISSNLLGVQAWADLSSGSGSSDSGNDEVGRAVTALMVGLEENAFLLADAVTSEKIIIKPTENILLSIRVMQSRNTHRQRFPSVEENISTSWTSTGDSVELASQALLANGDNGAVRVVFAAYHQLNRLLEYNSKNKKTFLNSKVICASLGRGRHIRLPEPVKINLRHLQPVDLDRVSPRCVYWDYLTNGWSSDGCQVIHSNVTHTRCQCSHLTNFALLMTEGKAAGRIVRGPNEMGRGGPRGGSDELGGRVDPALPVVTGTERAFMSKNVSTIVAAVATLISTCVICFFVYMAVKKLKVSTQCRNALGKSGILCFHKGKGPDDNATDVGTDVGDNESTKDKGNKGNFYTVTPKLTFNFRGMVAGGSPRGGNSPKNKPAAATAGSAAAAGGRQGAGENGGEAEAVPELIEAQQFFEHMIALQKNQEQQVNNKTGTSRRASTNLSGDPNCQQQSSDPVPNSDHVQNALNKVQGTTLQRGATITGAGATPGGGAANEPIYPKRNSATYGRALSPYNHIYMEIDNNLVPDNAEQQHQQQAGPPPPLPPLPAVYEPLSETYMMSTLSDMSEGDYQLRHSSDVSRQSSHRENRPLITRNNFQHQSYHPGVSGVANQNRNLLQTISGVLHSQSVRLAAGNGTTGGGSATLHHPGRGNRVNLTPGAQVIQWPDGTRTLTRTLAPQVATAVSQHQQQQQFVLEQIQPGQIQTAVHSQNVVQMPMVSTVPAAAATTTATTQQVATSVPLTSSATVIQPQFAHPVQSNGFPMQPHGAIHQANI